jgi:aspartyl protease family protein
VLVAPAGAADISVSALFNGKAVVIIDGGKPRTLSAGQSTPEGVKLVSATSEGAVIEFQGKRQTLGVGQGTRVATAPAESSGGRVILKADGRGHFHTEGWINGVITRFLVDTGATSIAMSSNDARRMGISYTQGTRTGARTASGTVVGYAVKLSTVRIGEITLQNVDAYVLEGDSPHTPLLGMSFLNRTQMNRDGDTLTLVRRY